MANGQTHGLELWRKDLPSGRLDRLLPDYPMQNYSVSQDGKQIAFAMNDPSGHANLWIAATSHRSSPIHVSSAAVEDSPHFLPNGDIIFRANEGGSNYVYRMRPDGSARAKMIPDRILDLLSVSPDGRWAVATLSNADEQLTSATKAFATDGSTRISLCLGYCEFTWDTAGTNGYLTFDSMFQGTYALPVVRSVGLPKFPEGGVGSADDKSFKGARTNAPIPWHVDSAVSPQVYAYTRVDTRRNLYRIQLP
jgi:hypothetical protein